MNSMHRSSGAMEGMGVEDPGRDWLEDLWGDRWSREKNNVRRGAKGATPFVTQNPFSIDKLRFHQWKTANFDLAPSAQAKTIELPPAMVEVSSGCVVTLWWLGGIFAMASPRQFNMRSAVATLRQLCAVYSQELYFCCYKIRFCVIIAS